MNTAKEIIQGRITSLKRQKWDIEYRQRELAALPEKIREIESKLTILKKEMESLPAVTDEEVLNAKKRKNELEKQLPKKEKGKDFPPEFKETFTAVQETAKKLSALQLARKAYSDKKDDIERNEKALAEYKSEYASYSFMAEEDGKIFSTLPVQIAEAEACLVALNAEVTWPMMLAKLAVTCDLAWKKKGKCQFCTDCPFYNKKKGGCNVQKQFYSRPGLWHIDEIQHALESTWGRKI